MANAAAATASQDESQPAQGKSRKMLIVGIVVASMLLGGGGSYYFLSRKAPADSAKVAEQAPPKPMMYLAMDTFTVNLRDAERERFLQATINLEVADAATTESIKQQMPSIRNRVLLLLSSKSAEDLLSREGKEKLSAEIVTELRKSLNGAGPSKGLEQVLFSHFVIQ